MKRFISHRIISSASHALESLENRLLFAGGELDTNFGFGAGYIESQIRSGQNDGFVIMRQTNGNLIAAGSTQASGAMRDGIVINYNAKGKFKPSFGNGGSSLINFGAGVDDIVMGGVIQADNKIVVVGITGTGQTQDIFIVRYKADGTTDKSFGASGVRKIDMGGTDFARGVIMDGTKIVVVGSTANQATGGGLFVLRLNANGTNDSGFGGGDGVFLTQPGIGKADLGTSIYKSKVNGNYIVGGARFGFNGSGFTDSQALLGRVKASDGTSDTTFNGSGWRTDTFGNLFNYYNAVSEGNNGIYASGGTSNGTDEFGLRQLPITANIPAATISDHAVAHVNHNGTPDNNFSGDGKQTVDAGGKEGGTGMAVQQQDGSVIGSGGSGITGQNARGYTFRLTKLGVLDALWGVNGVALVAIATRSVGFFSMLMIAGGLSFAIGHNKLSGGVGRLWLTRLRNTGSFSPAAVKAAPASMPVDPFTGFGTMVIDERHVLA